LGLSNFTNPVQILKKSPNAFRTISEASKELELPQHVLRFWESKFIQIRPLKRGGNRRYYRPEDIDLLRKIRSLLYDDGYTIKGVQRLLKETTKAKITVKDSSADTTTKNHNGAVKEAIEELNELKVLLQKHRK
tara:strand:- start:2415 stop:2816 length:402 start_codon:yes stop_codon:yes gene_type:complete